MHFEVQNWIDYVNQSILDGNGPTLLLDGFVQLGVEDPAACDCDYHDGALGWLHENHKEFNSAVHKMLSRHTNLILKLRRAMRADLKKDGEYGDGTPMVGYGAIVKKDYGQKLLDNFLIASPNPKWVE